MSRASEYRRLRNGGKCRPEGDNFSVEERRKERYAELKISRKGPDYVVKRAALKGGDVGPGCCCSRRGQCWTWVLLRQKGVMLNSDAVLAVWLVLLGLVSMRLYDRG